MTAFKRVKANKGSAGVDGLDIKSFEKDLKGNLYKIWNRMSSGSYFPPPIRIHSYTNNKIEMIAEMLSPMVRGWLNYFTKFNPSGVKYTIDCLNRRLVKWAMCKYKRFRGHRSRAENG